MIARADIVAAARALIGTPYRHQGRVAGERGGVDCLGLPIIVGWQLGARPTTWNVTGYRRLPDGHTLLRSLRRDVGRELDPGEALRPGDLGVFDWGRFPHHLGILGDHPGGGLSLIHASAISGRVEECRLVLGGQMRLVTAFQFPGVGDV
jgi:cell wall-associated NlpC family hydrolase